jgi:manganese/iron transport system permease protein
LSAVLDWFIEPFSTTFTQNALKELVLISVLSGVVGVYVVLRGIAFIVDGLSHAVLPGIAVALFFESNVFVGALVAALLVTILITFTGQHTQVSEDSAIGIFFTGAFALGVVLLSVVLSNKSRRGTSSDILFGQLFGVTDQDILNTLIVGGLIVLVFLGLRKELLLSSFDPTMTRAMGYPTLLFDLVLYLGVALTVVVALPAVGNILALAFLITPAATARLLTDRVYPLIFLSIVVALLASLTGLYLSYYLRLAGGASIVTVASGFFLLALVASPRHGLLARLLHRRVTAKVEA